MEQSDLDLLHTVPPYHLQTLIKSRQLPLPSRYTGTEPLTPPIPEIAQHLFDPTALNTTLLGLNERERLILYELVACGGRANSRDLALYLASSGLLAAEKTAEPFSDGAIPGSFSPAHPPGAPQYPVPHPHGAFELAVRHLLLLGLLFWGKQTTFSGRDYASGIHDGVLIVPQAVIKEASSIRAQGGKQQVIAGEHLGENIHAFQRTLYLYWSLVASTREGLPLVSNGLLARPALRQVVELFGPRALLEQIRMEQEVPRLLFIRMLLMKSGLLYERQGALRAAPAADFFALPLLERMRRCYRIWLETLFWNEMLHMPDVVIRPGPSPLEPAHEELLQARQMIMERVLYEQSGVWCDFATFIAHTRLYAPYLLFPRRYGIRTERYSVGNNPYGWDFRLRRGWLTHREGWYMVEGGFIRAVVSGPLHWLGLAELNDEDNPSAFRLTEGISLVAGTTDAQLDETPPGRLIVQPNFEVVALAPLSESLLINLDRFAERTSLERIAQYRLTKASVTHAIQAGLHANTIQHILEQASGGAIPQNIQYSLAEWERQARRIELWRNAVLLEVEDATLLDRLFDGEETRPLLGRRFSPKLVEVQRQHLPTLQEALWQHDYLPALVSAPTYDTLLEQTTFPPSEPQWRLSEDGLLQPVYAVSNLYLTTILERISDQDETTGQRRITPDSLQRACNGGLSLDYIVRFLQAYCEGGVPPSFLIRLKLWGDGYHGQSTIHVEHAPLLGLPSQVLQDVQADEELRELLGTETSQLLSFVHVAPDKLEQVIALLRERGFEVEQH